MRTLLARACCGRSSCTQSSALSRDEGTSSRCVTLDIGSRRHSDSLRQFGNCSGSYSIEYLASRWEETRPRHGQRRETDRTPGNDIRVSPEYAARHRLRGFRVCRIGSNRAAGPIVVLKRLAAAAHFLRAFAIIGVHWVYATTSEVEGAYIRLKDEDPDLLLSSTCRKRRQSCHCCRPTTAAGVRSHRIDPQAAAAEASPGMNGPQRRRAAELSVKTS